MLKIKYLLLSYLSASTFISSADESFFGFGKAGIISRYIFRGIDYNDRSAVVQADYILAFKQGWWVGGFGSNWSYLGETEWEIDLVTGYDYSLNDDVTLRTSVIRYFFPGVGGHTTEWSAGLLAYDWKIFHHHDQHLNSDYTDINYHHKFTEVLELRLHLGFYSDDFVSSQSDHEIRLSYNLSESVKVFSAYSSSELYDNVLYAGVYLLY